MRLKWALGPLFGHRLPDPLERRNPMKKTANEIPLHTHITNLRIAIDALNDWKDYNNSGNGGSLLLCDLLELRKLQKKLNETLSHGGVSFELEQEPPCKWSSYQTVWSEALELAIARCVSNGEPVTLSILCATEEAHASFGPGSDYDPDASASEQLVIRVETRGSPP